MYGLNTVILLPTNRTSINYQRLEVLLSSICSNRVVRSAQIEQLDVANLSSSSTKTKTITTSKTTSPSSKNEQLEREEKEQLLGNTLIAKSCSLPVAEDKLVSDEQTDFDKDHFSAVGDCTEKNFDELPCKESPAMKLELSAPTQTTPVNKSVNHEHDGNDRFTASSNQPVFEADTRTQLLTRLSVLTTEPVDSLRLNTALASALDRYSDRAPDALEYFQQAIATWKNRPGIGLFIHAVKTGQEPSLSKPVCGWKEWADEAIKRRLMQYSESHNGDIMVHFVSGSQGLWSQLRALSWAEVELTASGDRYDERSHPAP